jgi:DNA-binding SARP family transcriptional activator
MSTSESATGELPRFCILGPLEVRAPAGRPPVRVSPPLQRAVLVTLLLRAGEACPRAWLAEALWGRQGPADPASTLRTCVYRLRRSLGNDLGSRLRTCRGGFLIVAAEEEVDLRAYLAMDARGRLAWDRGETAAAAELLGAALRLWREPALRDLPCTPLAAAEKARLLVQRAATEETWLDTQLALGRHHEVVPQIWALAQQYPLREHVWSQLMLALHRSGDTAGAHRAYAAASDALAAEYGASPGPELAEIRRAIITGTTPPASSPASAELR